MHLTMSYGVLRLFFAVLDDGSDLIVVCAAKVFEEMAEIWYYE